MLYAVDVFGVDSSITLNLREATGPIHIKDIDGLGPVKASIATTPFASSDGEAILGKNVGKRNIVFKFGLNPDWIAQTNEELRKLLYTYFMPTFPVTLQFSTTHLPLVQIVGTVEDLVPNMFSSDPEVQVSIICERPAFVAVAESEVNGTTFVAASDAAIEAAVGSFVYEGNQPAGGVIKVETNLAHTFYLGEMNIYTQKGSGPLDIYGSLFQIEGVNIDDPRYFELSSVPGSKHVKDTDGTTETNLLNVVTGDFVWPTFWPGNNRFGIRTTTAGLDWSLTYFARYGGL